MKGVQNQLSKLIMMGQSCQRVGLDMKEAATKQGQKKSLKRVKGLRCGGSGGCDNDWKWSRDRQQDAGAGAAKHVPLGTLG